MQEAVEVLDVRGVSAEVICHGLSDEGWVRKSAHVPVEKEITVYVNLRELVTILCTPLKVNFLVLGFLYSENIISGAADVLTMRTCEDESEVDVRLSNPEFELPTKRRLTSGCGGGSTFTNKGQKVDSSLVVTPAQVLAALRQLQEYIDLHQVSGGIHSSALSDTEKLLVVTEDIGRHNTLDKIQGECLAREIATKDRIVLTTGRVSSEMLLKTARMQTPVVVSRHTPTATAVSLARDLDIALVGRSRGSRLTVYSHPERLGGSVN